MLPSSYLVGPDGQLEPSGPIFYCPPPPPEPTLRRWNAVEGVAAMLLLPLLVWYLLLAQ